MMAKRWAGAAVLTAALALVGCEKRVPPPMTEPKAEAEYHIGRADVLEVSVWRDNDLTRQLPVRPDGKISMPLIGEVVAQGRTAPELAAEIGEKLKPFVENPRVAVIVREVNAPRFNVIGEVQKPGSYAMRGNVTVLQALSEAGGFNQFADQDGIVIVRNSGAKTQRYTIKYSELVQGDGNGAVYLDQGDTLYVP